MQRRQWLTVLCVLTPAALGGQSPPWRAAFLIMRGTDTVAIERFTRDGTTLAGDNIQENGSRTTYTARLRPDHSVARIEFETRGVTGMDGGVIDFDSRSLVLNHYGSVDTTSRRIVTPALPMPAFMPSFALFEQMVRAARPVRGSATRLTVFALRALDTVPVTIRAQGPDSVRITFRDVEFTAVLSPNGDIVSAIRPDANQNQTIRVERATDVKGLPDYVLNGFPYDTTFDTRVARPAFPNRDAGLLIDPFLLTWVKPLTSLLANDGYRIAILNSAILEKRLAGQKVVVLYMVATPFSREECAVLREWVSRGGGLLLVTDHAEGQPTPCVAAQFGVQARHTYTTDSLHTEKGDRPGWLLFSRENGLLRDHPITRGLDSTERLRRVKTYLGTSLSAPSEAIPFLQLSDRAVDHRGRATEGAVSAAGRAQGVALRYGKGRVVVLGEMRVLTAFRQPVPFIGMNEVGTDNRQFALNLIHWLSGVLDSVH